MAKTKAASKHAPSMFPEYDGIFNAKDIPDRSNKKPRAVSTGATLFQFLWHLFTQNEKLLADPRFEDAAEIEPIEGLETWTDSFNNLFKVVK